MATKADLRVDSATHLLTEPGWLRDPVKASLGPDEVHVWLLDAGVDDEVAAARSATSSADERERVARVPAPRRRRALCATWRRSVLAGYVHDSSAQLRFRRHPAGALTLDHPRMLTFSTSHARDLSLFVVTSGRSIGIDVEPLSAATHIEEIADAYLPRERVDRIRTTPRERCSEEWLRLWTELEACAKLDGRGLGDLSPSSADTLLRQPGHRLHFRPDNDHVATLVYTGRLSSVSFFLFERGRESRSSEADGEEG
jgi:4'-phosphopantetheinyl transferase